jgi:hypothetical protein
VSNHVNPKNKIGLSLLQRNWKVFEDALLGTAPQMELGELNKEIE